MQELIKKNSLYTSQRVNVVQFVGEFYFYFYHLFLG